MEAGNSFFRFPLDLFDMERLITLTLIRKPEIQGSNAKQNPILYDFRFLEFKIGIRFCFCGLFPLSTDTNIENLRK
ncbi:hypothetical protein CH380_04120 [Leptospira adleri]|uniref:Uncharacterized protein n=1 Tax=Leptospira adleri TaxID=2023186 RepID=A0A2M9YTP4_9LEPT|nr:hypothetical protein CH380_04120 [Leptospira adleri]PJZ60868.1 hypothetical protein CH376_16245 [Leptospira adleri]